MMDTLFVLDASYASLLCEANTHLIRNVRGNATSDAQDGYSGETAVVGHTRVSSVCHCNYRRWQSQKERTNVRTPK